MSFDRDRDLEIIRNIHIQTCSRCRKLNEKINKCHKLLQQIKDYDLKWN